MLEAPVHFLIGLTAAFLCLLILGGLGGGGTRRRRP